MGPKVVMEIEPSVDLRDSQDKIKNTNIPPMSYPIFFKGVDMAVVIVVVQHMTVKEMVRERSLVLKNDFFNVNHPNILLRVALHNQRTISWHQINDIVRLFHGNIFIRYVVNFATHSFCLTFFSLSCTHQGHHQEQIETSSSAFWWPQLQRPQFFKAK